MKMPVGHPRSGISKRCPVRSAAVRACRFSRAKTENTGLMNIRLCVSPDYALSGPLFLDYTDKPVRRSADGLTGRLQAGALGIGHWNRRAIRPLAATPKASAWSAECVVRVDPVSRTINGVRTPFFVLTPGETSGRFCYHASGPMKSMCSTIGVLAAGLILAGCRGAFAGEASGSTVGGDDRAFVRIPRELSGPAVLGRTSRGNAGQPRRRRLHCRTISPMRSNARGRRGQLFPGVYQRPTSRSCGRLPPNLRSAYLPAEPTDGDHCWEAWTRLRSVRHRRPARLRAAGLRRLRPAQPHPPLQRLRHARAAGPW